MSKLQIIVDNMLAGKTLAAVLRSMQPQLSWSRIEKQVARSDAFVNQVACLDAARRMKQGDLVAIRSGGTPRVNWLEQIRVLHVDHHLAVVDKPSGLTTERRPEERNWPARRKALQPALDELLPQLLADSRTKNRPSPRAAGKIILVHRLDRDTSGVMVVARTKEAAEHLTSQFRRHSAQRVYRAVVNGHPGDVTIKSRFVRDRGDGLRGSVDSAPVGKEAITHVHELERIGPYALVECRLETGRTNQIRIHLAERNCLVSGDLKYNRRLDGSRIDDFSEAPRLALHAMELEFLHPVSQQTLRFVSPWPDDLDRWLNGLRESNRS